MTPSSPFLRHLLRNLRFTFFMVVAAVGVIVGYALVSKTGANWWIVIALSLGMTASSIVNAVIDTRKERRVKGEG